MQRYDFKSVYACKHNGTSNYVVFGSDLKRLQNYMRLQNFVQAGLWDTQDCAYIMPIDTTQTVDMFADICPRRLSTK